MKVGILDGSQGSRLSEEASRLFFEQEPTKRLTGDGQLSAHFDHGFLQCRDMLRDEHYLDGLWASCKTPWKIW
jgi:hypothetical protein